MLRDAWFIAAKDVRHSLGLVQVWIWMLIMPLLLAYIIGSLMQGQAPGPRRLAVYVPAGGGFLAGDLVRRLGAAGYELNRVSTAAEVSNCPLGIRLPDSFTETVLAGRRAEVELTVYEAGNIAYGFDQFRLVRVTGELQADLALLKRRGLPRDATALARLEAEPHRVTLREEGAGQRRHLVLGFEQSMPGFLVTFTLLVALTTGGVLMVMERRAGVLRRLASTPVTRGSLVAGKLGARWALGLVQVAMAMLAGRWWLGVRWGDSNLWMVLVLMAVYTLMCSSVALCFTSLVATESQALAAGLITSNVLAAVGGCWWPVEITPPWLHMAARLVPTGWAMDALHRLVSYGEGPANVLPHLAALGVLTVVIGWVAARRFRYE